MAQAQYRKAARPAGFTPVQVSGQNIARMREESDRVAQGMRAARDAEIQDRQRIQAAMKENADYTRRALRENQAIAGTNANEKVRQLSLDAQTSVANFEEKQREATTVFKSVANLSETAAKKINELEQQRFDEDYARELIEYDPSSNETITQIKGEGELAAITEEQQSKIDEAEAKGADPLGVAQARSMSAGAQYARKQADANYLLSVVYPQKLQEYFLKNSELLSSSGDTAASIAVFQRDFFESSGLRSAGYRPEMLRNGLIAMRQTNQSYVLQARRTETNNLYEMQADIASTNLTNNPAQFEQNVQSSFRTWARNPNIGYSGALDRYESLATERGPNGEFLFTMEQLGNADLKGTGKPFSQEWAARYEKMQQARLVDTNRFLAAQNQADDIAYQKDLNRIMKGLAADPTKANYEAAKDFFLKKYSNRGLPPVLVKFGESYTNEAIDKAKQIERLEEIPIGLIQQEDVDALAGLDWQAGQRLGQKYALQEQRYNSGTFKDISDSFTSVANGLTTFGTNKPNNPGSIFLQNKMRAEYRRRVDEAVAGGANFNVASSQIGQELAAEVKAGFNDDQSRWYRKIDPKTQEATFPNLSKNQASAVKTANERYQLLKERVIRDGVAKVITTPESIITRAEANEIVSAYGTARFIVPSDVLAVAAMSNGGDPFVIINAQLEALGMQPLPPPPSMQVVGEASPAFRKLLFKTPSFQRSLRAMGGMSSSGFRPELVPGGYAPMVQQAATAAGIGPALVAAMAEIESGWNPGTPSYNGSSFGLMQIHRSSHPEFFETNDWKDPQASLNYGAKFFASLIKRYNGDVKAAAMAYNAGPGAYDEYAAGVRYNDAKEREMINHGIKFMKAYYKYGGGTQALNTSSNLRFNFRQLVTGNPGIQTSADGARVYDPDGHGGRKYHDHFELSSKEEVLRMEKLLNNTIDPWTGKPYRVTDTYRPGDPKAHGAYRAIDVAPPVTLPVSEEQAWSEHLYKVLGLDPYSIK